MSQDLQAPLIAIACGGTGGHLFPGLAVAEALSGEGAELMLFISTKEVDRGAIESVGRGIKAESLPAVGWDPVRPWRFVLGTARSWGQVRRCFLRRRPDAVLAMGGFTSVAPVLEARRLGVRVFLHESNVIPGRANRWLARWVDGVFVGFPEATERLRAKEVREVGTPVRAEFRVRTRRECRRAFGLDPDRPVLLVSGGSQGARAVNRLVVDALARFRDRLPRLQFLHLAGRMDEPMVADAYRRVGVRSRVYGFLDRMGEALGSADLAISRAGASSLAELAAARVPALLIPYPSAADDHQVFNARAFADAGAAIWQRQHELDSDALVNHVVALLSEPDRMECMRGALDRRHRPHAASEMARDILRSFVPSGAEPGFGARPTRLSGDHFGAGRDGGSLSPCVAGCGQKEGSC